MLTPIAESRSELIQRELREQIRLGKWQPRQRIDTEHALAKHFGVCRQTVNQALRELQREGLLRSNRGGGRYVVHPAERTKTGTIGVVVPDLSLLGHPVTAGHLAGIRQVCLSEGRHLQIFGFNASAAHGASSDPLDQLHPRQLDGILLTSWWVPLVRLAELSRDIPVVGPIEAESIPRISSVKFDHATGTRDAASHLAALGHRDVALVTVTPDKYQGKYQGQGVRLALDPLIEAGGGRVRVLRATTNRSDEWVGEFGRMLSDPDRPTAVIFGSDDLTLTGLPAIERSGLRIPDDLSIISMNDLLAPPQVPVPLTTMKSDFHAYGVESAKLLMRMIEDPSLGQVEKLIPVDLIVRQSTQPPRKTLV